MSVEAHEWLPEEAMDEVIPPPPRPDPSKNPGRVFPSDKSGCDGLVGMIFGHRYEARWDTVTPPTPVWGYLTAFDREAIKDRTYRGDVCRRCGNVVNEPKES